MERVITFNVGGELIATYLSTLSRDQDGSNKLVELASHAPTLNGGSFVDRSPKVFHAVLDFLRTGSAVGGTAQHGTDSYIAPGNAKMAADTANIPLTTLLAELDYFKIHSKKLERSNSFHKWATFWHMQANTFVSANLPMMEKVLANNMEHGTASFPLITFTRGVPFASSALMSGQGEVPTAPPTQLFCQCLETMVACEFCVDCKFERSSLMVHVDMPSFDTQEALQSLFE
eukprot:TRINITY_DN5077_c0_g1_i1.p1 TRINITY_DN5077_c0_g1~~TRINITY_DN5077_c0_g1_i1.p1  ORF type:complete len:243 (-),score=74.81 TRINITY_DN5077_c0_g1_i1:50-742(-)